jgi:hypothetical protein
MPRHTTVIAFRQPQAIDDPLTEVTREGARRMLAQVLIAEAASFIAMWKDLKLRDGRIVPQGHSAHRAIQTGVRESAQSWRELLVDSKQRGLEIAPDLAVGDGALGFLEGDRRGLPGHQASALLGSQDRQRAEQGRPARQGGRLPDEGSGSDARLLRLLSRALGPSTYQTRSRACSRRCGIEPCGQREPCRPRPPSSWCSNWSMPLRKRGDD